MRSILKSWFLVWILLYLRTFFHKKNQNILKFIADRLCERIPGCNWGLLHFSHFCWVDHYFFVLWLMTDSATITYWKDSSNSKAKSVDGQNFTLCARRSKNCSHKIQTRLQCPELWSSREQSTYFVYENPWDLFVILQLPKIILKVGKSRKKYDVLDSSKKQMKLTILSTEGVQDSEFHLFFGRIQDAIICFRDILTFNILN